MTVVRRESHSTILREGVAVSAREYGTYHEDKSQRHHEYCCEHVDLTYLNGSHAIRGSSQGVVLGAIGSVDWMADDLTAGDNRITEIHPATVEHRQAYSAGFFLRHYSAGCHSLIRPLTTRRQHTHRHNRHENTSDISGSEGFHGRSHLVAVGSLGQQSQTNVNGETAEGRTLRVS